MSWTQQDTDDTCAIRDLLELIEGNAAEVEGMTYDEEAMGISEGEFLALQTNLGTRAAAAKAMALAMLVRHT